MCDICPHVQLVFLSFRSPDKGSSTVCFMPTTATLALVSFYMQARTYCIPVFHKNARS